MQPLSGNQRPNLLTSLMNMSLLLCLPREMHLFNSFQILCNLPRLPLFLEILQNSHILLTFGKVQNPLRLLRKTTSEPSKVVRHWCVLYILTWICASRHNGVPFFDISTCKSGLTLFGHLNFQKRSDTDVFCTFWLEMCFAPQRRALFRHLNFQRRSDTDMFCAFWLANVLRATTACTFWTFQLPKVLRTWCALHILTWKCALRHNGVQLFISHLTTWLRTRRFSQPTFRPSGATNHWKNTVNRDFSTFSRTWIFFLLTSSDPFSSLIFSLLLFSSLTLTTSAFHLSILSEVWLLNFLRWAMYK